MDESGNPKTKELHNLPPSMTTTFPHNSLLPSSSHHPRTLRSLNQPHRTPTIMAPSSLIIKGTRTRRAPKRYSPSPTTTTFPASRTQKRGPKKEKTSPKAKTTTSKKKTTTTKPPPKPPTKAQKTEKKNVTTRSSPPQTRILVRKANTRQRALSHDSYYLYGSQVTPPFNNKLTRAQIKEIERLVSPWYTVDDIISRLRSVRKKAMLDD